MFVTLLSTLRVCQNYYFSEGPNLVCYLASAKIIGFEIGFWRQLKLEDSRGFSWMQWVLYLLIEFPRQTVWSCFFHLLFSECHTWKVFLNSLLAICSPWAFVMLLQRRKKKQYFLTHQKAHRWGTCSNRETGAGKCPSELRFLRPN